MHSYKEQRERGYSFKDTFGKFLSDDRLMQLVRDDVTATWRPASSDWRDTEKQEKAKLDKKVKETFELMQRSSKVNKLIGVEFATICNEYEESSAMKGGWQQDRAKKRLRSDIFKMSHERKENRTNLYMHEGQATDAARLEELIETKWYHKPQNFKIISKISPKGNDRLNRLLDGRGFK